MAEPRIYSQNWINSETVITPTHGGIVQYLYDTNPSTQWVTTGANSDAIYSEIVFEFYSAGVLASRTIDTIFIKNTNISQINVYRWNGSSWVNVWSNYSGVSPQYASVSSFSSTKVRVTLGSTVAANNDEKRVGEIVFCNLTLAADDMASYDTKWREKTKEIVLGDGSIHRVVTRAVSGRIGRYEARCRWSYLSKATRDNMKAIKEAGQPFLWQPESVTVPEEVYYVHWTNTWDDKYMSNFKGAGYEVVMDLKEV